MFIKDIGLQFSFFVVHLSGFRKSVILALLKDFGSVLFPFILWKSLSYFGISSSLKVWQNSAENPSGFSDISFLGDCLIMFQFH
jgi:hypothetical protein